MIQKYPVGIQDFEKLRRENFLYVDKTDFVYQMANIGGYYFLSRPRRFGKSLFISTLECLFLAKKELFKGLFIEDKWNWEQTFPIIRISFSNIGHKSLGLKEAIDTRLDEIAKEYGVTFSAKTIDQKFKELIVSLSASRGKVVVLIDEYDRPIIDYLGEDTAKAIENRDIMKVFYSILKDADPHLKLVFITGVSKFSRVSIFSDLNNLTDITLSHHFSASCGISETELETYFREELQVYDKEKIRAWYNGYSWDLAVRVYNPFSLMHFFREGKFHNYWFDTGTPTFLIKLAKQIHLYDFENKETSLSHLNSYDLERLELIPLMFQTGYLTFKSYDEEGDIYTLGFPNKEVKKSYLEVLLDAVREYPSDQGVVLVNELRKTLLAGNIEKLESILNSLFKSLPYELWQKENEHFYHAIIHLAFTLLGVYVQSEVQTSDGRMDALVRMKEYIYCFEFKLDGSAEEALKQIKDKGYLQPFAQEGKKLIGIGINFSTEKKRVEALKWEEIV